MTPRLDAATSTFLVTASVAAFALLGLPRRSREREDAMAEMQAVVLRVEEDGLTRTVRAPLPITIGRAPSATLVVSDPLVSRLHARIDLSDGVPRVRDLDSRNGTLVNAHPIEGAVGLREGDEIGVGLSRIVYAGVRPWR